MSIATIIWHIADLHIERKRHQAIQYAFDQLFHHIKQHSDSTQYLCVVGDIFEHKTKYSQTDLECFHDLLNRSQTIPNLKVIIMPGNHDYSEAHNLDLVSAALINTKYENVYHFPQSGVYNFSELDFYVFSPLDQIKPTSPTASPTMTKIAMIHEPIKGCKAYGGHTIMEARFDADELSSKFDITLLGDIHKKQFLKPNVAYPGSFVQKTKAEDYQHGCIKWTLPGATGEFINFDQINLYLTIQVEDNKLISFNTNHIKSIKYIELVHNNTTKPALSKAITTITKKFGMPPHQIKSIATKPQAAFATTNAIPDTVQSQLDIIHSMLKEAGTEQLWEDVKQLHLTRTTQRKEKYKWTINRLEWSNVFCYGHNNHIDFNEFTQNSSKVYSLIGRNKTGKSSILDIMLLVLFNQLFRGTRNGIIRKGCDEFTIACNFKVGPDQYRIERTTDKHDKSKHRFIKTYPEEINLTGATVVETYERMRELIGDHKEFLNVNMAMQNSQLFTDSNAQQQRIRILQFLELEHLHTLSKDIDQEVRILKKTITALNSALPKTTPPRNDYATMIKEIEFQLDSVQHQVTKLLPRLSIIIRPTINTSIQTVQDSIQKLSKIQPSQNLSTDRQTLQTLTKELASMPSTVTDASETTLTEEFKTLIRESKITTMPKNLQEAILYCETEIQKLAKTITSVPEKYKSEPTPPSNTSVQQQSQATIRNKITDLTQQLGSIAAPQPVSGTRQFYEAMVATSLPNIDKAISETTAAIAKLKQTIIHPPPKRETNHALNELNQILQSPPPIYMQVPAITAKPTKPAIPTIPAIPIIPQITTDIKQLITTLRQRNIAESLKHVVKFNQNCSCCESNKTLFIHNGSDQTTLKQLEQYLRDLMQYEAAEQQYNAKLSAEANNSVLLKYEAAKHDIIWHEQQELQQQLKELQQKLTSLCAIQTIDRNTAAELKRLAILKELDTLQTILVTASEHAEYEIAKQQYQTHLSNLQTNSQIATLQSLLAVLHKISATRVSKRRHELTTQIETLQSSITLYEFKQDLKDLQYNEAIKSERQSVIATHNDLLTQQKQLQSKLQQLKLDQQALESYDTQYKTIVGKEHELTVKQAYSKCLCLNTGISEKLLNLYLDQFEQHVNQILHDITDFTIVFARSKDSNFTYTKQHNNDGDPTILPADLASGFQRWIIDTAIRIAFASRHPTLPSFLIIDEGFGCMDPEHLSNMREFLNTIDNSPLNLDWILIVSHIDELNQVSSKHLSIQHSGNNCSSLRFPKSQ
jgi:DNA repair exonuclease SbcCD ATPase subunit